MPLTTLTPAVSVKKQVAARCGMWNRPVAWAHREANCWMNIPVLVATSNIEVQWANYRLNTAFNGVGNNQEMVEGSTLVTRRAALEVVGVGIYPLYTVDGSRDLVLNPGEVGRLYLNNQAVPAGSHVLRWRTICDEVPHRWGTFESNQASITCKHEFGAGLSDRTLAASWGSPSNPESYAVDPPQAIIGDSTSRKTVEIWGDSIGSAAQSDGGYVGDLGFIMRACITGGVPFINNGRGGQAAWQIASESAEFKTSRLRRRSIVPKGSIGYVFLQLCTNDFNWGTNYDAMVANLALLKAQAEAQGSKLIPFTCPPRTNATNNGKFSSDSVNVATYRQQYNAYLRANEGVGHGFFDLAAVLEEGETGFWKAGFIADGIHPNQAAHTAARDALIASLPELLSEFRN